MPGFSRSPVKMVSAVRLFGNDIPLGNSKCILALLKALKSCRVKYPSSFDSVFSDSFDQKPVFMEHGGWTLRFAEQLLRACL